MSTRAQQPGTDLVPIVATEAPIPCPDTLTEMQHRFCLAYVWAGTGNASAAARKAGYAPSNARHTGSALLQRADIQAHIRALTAVSLGALAPIGVAVMRKLALHSRSDVVKQLAARDILDRTGFKPPDRHSFGGGGGITITIDLG